MPDRGKAPIIAMVVTSYGTVLFLMTHLVFYMYTEFLYWGTP